MAVRRNLGRTGVYGRPPLFTEEQVRAFRQEYAMRQKYRSMHKMAKDAGVDSNAMQQMIKGLTYKWVRE